MRKYRYEYTFDNIHIIIITIEALSIGKSEDLLFQIVHRKNQWRFIGEVNE
jgi:hypothetical protein